MGRRAGRLDRAGGGAEHNLIQRPDLLQRVQQFLGMRQAHVLPSLNEGVQPVLIIGDLDRPTRIGGRRSATQTISSIGINTAAAGVAICAPAAKPYMRLHLRRAILGSFNTAAIAPATFPGTSVTLFYHPSSPTVLGVPMEPGHGGEAPDRVRSGLTENSDGSGFNSNAGGQYYVPPIPSAVPSGASTGYDYVEIDLSGYVLDSDPKTSTGGAGQALWFVCDNANAGLYLQAFWDEEPISP